MTLAKRRGRAHTAHRPGEDDIQTDASASARASRVCQKIVGSEEETAGTAGRVGDRFARLGADAFDHGADQGTRREVLAGA